MQSTGKTVKKIAIALGIALCFSVSAIAAPDPAQKQQEIEGIRFS
jgi:hypothetical protein